MNHESSHTKLAFQATTHCLTGCGIGDVVGVVIGTALGFAFFERVIIGIILGFIFGFALGILPLLKMKMTFAESANVVVTTELFSIIAMETAEALTEIFFPGMKKNGILNLNYWLGLASALIAGFVVAYPVNLQMVKRGIRHHH